MTIVILFLYIIWIPSPVEMLDMGSLCSRNSNKSQDPIWSNVCIESYLLDCNGNLTYSFGRMIRSIQFVTFIEFLKTILHFLPEPFRASHPLPSPQTSLRTAHRAFYFIISHLHSLSATQLFFLSLPACSSFGLLLYHPYYSHFLQQRRAHEMLNKRNLASALLF